MTEKDRIRMARTRAGIERKMWGRFLNPTFYSERSHWRGDDQKLPLYHGLRTKNPDVIFEKGFCAFVTRYDAREEILKALRYFGKERLIRIEGMRGELIRHELAMMGRVYRRTIHVTTDGKVGACCWAERNPEFIYFTLHHAGIDDEDTYNYLSETYGAQYVISLKETYPIPNPNLSLRQQCLPPEQIESIEPCHDLFQDPCRELEELFTLKEASN